MRIPGALVAAAFGAALSASCAAARPESPVADEPFAAEIASLRDTDPAVRLRALAALRSARADGAAVVVALTDALTDPARPELGAQAADALGRTAPATPRSVAALVAALTSDDEFVVAFAARSLGRISMPSADEAVSAARALDVLAPPPRSKCPGGRRARIAARGDRSATPTGLAGTAWYSSWGFDIIGGGREDWLSLREAPGVRYAHQVRFTTTGVGFEADDVLEETTTTWDADATDVRIGDRRATWAVLGNSLEMPAIVQTAERRWRYVDVRPGEEASIPWLGEFDYEFDAPLALGASGLCRIEARPQSGSEFAGTAPYLVETRYRRPTLTIGLASVAGEDRELGAAEFGFEETLRAGWQGSGGYFRWRLAPSGNADLTERQATEALFRILDGPFGVDTAIALLDGGSESSADRATESLERRGESAAPAFAALFARQKSNPDCGRALVAIGKPAVAPLATLARDPDAESRSCARWTLLALHQRGVDVSAAVPSVVASLETAEFKEIELSLEALGGFGADAAGAVPFLAAWIDARRTLFGRAARTLGQIGPAAKEALPALERLAEDTKGAGPIAKAAIEKIRATGTGRKR